MKKYIKNVFNGLCVVLAISIVPLGMYWASKEDAKSDAEREVYIREHKLTNEQIVEKTKYCYSNGLDAEEVYTASMIQQFVSDIRCTPKKQPEINQGKKSNATMIITN